MIPNVVRHIPLGKSVWKEVDINETRHFVSHLPTLDQYQKISRASGSKSETEYAPIGLYMSILHCGFLSLTPTTKWCWVTFTFTSNRILGTLHRFLRFCKSIPTETTFLLACC